MTQRARLRAVYRRPGAARRRPARPTQVFAASNIPIRVPEHFLGRDDALAAVDAALKRDEGRVAITALHGLRGVGKTTLAAAYAERHRADYRATWWIRAQTESTMRADLVALGVRLGWVAADEKEEPALAAVRERLRARGRGAAADLRQCDRRGEPEALSAARRRGARAGHLERSRLARRSPRRSKSASGPRRSARII